MIVDSTEYVSPGHPDKMADQLADALLDYYLSFDRNSRTAIEVLFSHSLIVIAGEVSSQAPIPPYEDIIREVLEKIGYTSPWDTLTNSHQLIVEIASQSKELERCVQGKEKCSGDQGIVIGYACDETPSYMPLTYEITREIARQIDLYRRNQHTPLLGPDGKLEVLFKKENRIDLILSWQHLPGGRHEEIEQAVRQALQPLHIPFMLDTLHINPGGPFTIGGPSADTGLTGRKQQIDTYGSHCRHGGGSFSGKDGTKVDRSGAYMARCMAKTVVASGLAKECEVRLVWMNGSPTPIDCTIDCGETERYPLEQIHQALLKTFDLHLESIISLFLLDTPLFFPTSTFGHFGRIEFPWETQAFIPTLLKNIH